MQVGLRKIKMSRWVDRPSDLSPGDATADSVTNLQTSKNTLSVFFLPSDDATMLRRVATAMAFDSDSLEHFEYYLFPIDEFASLGLKTVAVAGTTSDGVVNEWHRDIVALTGTNLVSIAHFLGERTAARLLKLDIAKEAIVGWNERRYSRPPKCLKDLNKLGFPQI